MMEPRSLSPDKWVDNYADELYRYTMLRVKHNAVAEDLVQETFLSGWRAKEMYTGEASERNWLYAICKNKIMDHYRKKANFIVNPTSQEESIYFDEAEHWRAETKPKSWGMDYGQPIETKEFYLVLDQCKRKLKDIQQHVFVMKYMEDMEAENICEVLNITTSNYWVLIHRCKLHLRGCLEKNWLNIF